MKKHLFILVLMAAALVSCANEPRGNFDYDVFNHERQLWMEQDIKNYFYDYSENSSAGSMGAIMYIQDGVLAYVQFNDDIVEGTDFPQYFFYGNTISDIYAKIEIMANSAYDTIGILYDSEWHYPMYFSIYRAGGYFDIIHIYKFNVGAEVF